MQDIPLSLYAHFPWCVRKCPYCDFNSHELREPELVAAYGAALRDDLQRECDRTDRPIETMFLGGGTPSLMPPDDLHRLLTAAAGRTNASAEITLEANPGTADAGNFAHYRQAGVNRLSIGAQSFSDASLAQLGRIHTAAEAVAAFHTARKAGFANINIDLMHGLPGQTAQGAVHDLEQALALAPEHISWYQLTIEPNTVFHRRPPQLPVESTLGEINEAGHALLTDAGYRRYEVSAYARDEFECRHNVNYWEFGDYLGIGAGAHGKITLQDGIHRTQKTRVPADYIDNARTAVTLVPTGDVIAEFLMNALRLYRGFTSAQFEQRTGLGFSSLDSFINEGMGQELLLMEDEAGETRLRASRKGYRYLDSLLLLAV